MQIKKRLIYVEDAISLLEKDIAENKDTLQHAYHGDKEAIREEINGVKEVPRSRIDSSRRGIALENSKPNPKDIRVTAKQILCR